MCHQKEKEEKLRIQGLRSNFSFITFHSLPCSLYRLNDEEKFIQATINDILSLGLLSKSLFLCNIIYIQDLTVKHPRGSFWEFFSYIFDTIFNGGRSASNQKIRAQKIRECNKIRDLFPFQ